MTWPGHKNDYSIIPGRFVEKRLSEKGLGQVFGQYGDEQ
jgi:hypothetical protein